MRFECCNHLPKWKSVQEGGLFPLANKWRSRAGGQEVGCSFMADNNVDGVRMKFRVEIFRYDGGQTRPEMGKQPHAASNHRDASTLDTFTQLHFIIRNFGIAQHSAAGQWSPLEANSQGPLPYQ